MITPEIINIPEAVIAIIGFALVVNGLVLWCAAIWKWNENRKEVK